MSKRNRSVRSRVAALAGSMPDQTVAFLLYAAGAIFATYLVLVIYTVSLATVQTGLAAEVRAMEGSIASLETTYYAAIASQNASTPAQIGLVAPSEVVYATQKHAQALTFARN